MALSLPRIAWRAEEARIEAVAFMDETAEAMGQLIHFEVAGNSAAVIDLAGRVAFRAGLARAEVLRLRAGGNDDAAA